MEIDLDELHQQRQFIEQMTAARSARYAALDRVPRRPAMTLDEWWSLAAHQHRNRPPYWRRGVITLRLPPDGPL